MKNIDSIYTCQYCNRELQAGAAKFQHERACDFNPDLEPPYPKTGHPRTNDAKIIHLVVRDPEYVDKFHRLFKRLGCQSNNEAIRQILDLLDEVEP